MPKKIIPANQRIKTGMCVSVPVYVREQVEALAERKSVTLSEIGRLAFEQYVERQKAGAR